MLNNLTNKGLQVIVATIAAVSLCSYILYETNQQAALSPDDTALAKDKVLLQVLVQSLQNSHYEPKEIDDEFSADAFDLYIKRLDFNKRFLLQDDIDELLKFRTQLDDEVKSGDYKFFDRSYDIITQRVEEAKKYYQDILKKPFDLNAKEEIELDEEKRMYAQNKKELKDHWRQALKHQTLVRIARTQENQEKRDTAVNSDTIQVLTLEEMEAKSREKLLKSHDRWFDRLEKLDRDDRKEVYLNSLLNVFGPHTGYFPPKDKENFDISMSGQLEGIGAQLQEKDGYIKVTRIVPGSPSYRQGELEEGDVILKVGQASEEAVDVVDMRLDDAVQLIRGKKGTEVRLTIEKVNGSIKTISIIRDIVVLEETYAKSVIVENEAGVKVGYIRLPKFYADFNHTGGRSASDDVKKELEKLKAENVEGVILDLRSNGGGSLQDAIDLTGHFIEKGPVVQVKSRYGRPQIMNDRDSKTTYDGPLVILTNHFSASASEIVAAAIQDYNRGIIMGAKSSFGKGTVQRFYGLDQMLTPAYASYKPLGAVKVTTQKFYRINGGATQLRGVTPDIIVPDQYNYLEMGEAQNEFVMEWDEIEPASYSEWIPAYDEALIITKSGERIGENDVMQKIGENAERLKKQRDETRISLNYEDFKKREEELEKAAEKYDNLMEPIESLEIVNLAVDYERISQDSVKLDINEKWLKDLKKDVFLNEAIYVIGDIKRQQG